VRPSIESCSTFISAADETANGVLARTTAINERPTLERRKEPQDSTIALVSLPALVNLARISSAQICP
jgi:hypothetical protein